MSNLRDDESAAPEAVFDPDDQGDLSEAGARFDDELHDAEAEADDEFEI